ncbi:hypothetical protein [Ornithinimicrobium sediminis]|uniref:hypothetical protein n=1 Tax=Ornithinimicrobium sediminis TaxID=2904603 RepID=UPI001E2D1A91|nr:hypothetical protein [Ornithinimicrobium sediminis]MCE0488144.1 hypothetical protein [Ornithinimicrobium sediminis]
MSTAPTYPPLYAVPEQPPLVTSKGRFASLLHLRATARRARDTAQALPRSARTWVVRQWRTLLTQVQDSTALGWLGSHLARGLTLVRRVGVVPLAAAVLSTPPVTTAVTRITRASGHTVADLARHSWVSMSALLARAGTPGLRVRDGLGKAGAYLWFVAFGIQTRPATDTARAVLTDALQLVRPVSHTVVAHRLLHALVGPVWVRAVLEVLVVPFLIDPRLHQGVRTVLKGSPTEPAVATVTDIRPTEPPSRKQEGKAVTVEQPVTASTNGDPMNRAARRAHQQEQARARRTVR